ncbi:hypothetical protein [Streptantibioticus silvisoli]|uniref:Uncharacterized protein n=1 Tax=Streptantibioticus silvisoli TaxID=2705255 RepID=A0ABT6W2M2_9ACTN|nr:hypothetical protein [Streptantibioticus silvisoli]MDI5964995.1 hypothetical protein [Streptantibioticus silvisoli]
MVDMALLSRTIVSPGSPLEDGELIDGTTPPAIQQHGSPPKASTSTPERGHATRWQAASTWRSRLANAAFSP